MNGHRVYSHSNQLLKDTNNYAAMHNELLALKRMEYKWIRNSSTQNKRECAEEGER